MEILYHTLHDFFRSIGLPLEQDTELTVHSLAGLHGDRPLSSPLFRTNYYTFLLIEKGRGRYTIDNLQFDLGPYSFYFTNPGHLKSFAIDELLEGYMLTFSTTFVKQHFAGDFFQSFPFLLHESSPAMQLDAEAFDDLAQLFAQLRREYNRPSPYRQSILTKLLAVLLYKTKELLLSHRAEVRPATRGAVIAGQFKTLLQENFQQLAAGQAPKVRSVKEFAEQLAVHPNYLTNVVKAETGKPASEWIQERTLAEAQSQLLNSSLAISEIGYRLGFADAAHFARFFRKRTAVSPSTYRQMGVRDR